MGALWLCLCCEYAAWAAPALDAPPVLDFAAVPLPELLAQARESLARGAATEACVILLAHEGRFAGDGRYDALLGRALLANDQPQRASLVLERVTLVDPQAAGARLDLAIAYFRMGARVQSRAQLLSLRKLNPPPGAAQTIEQYLVALDAEATRPAAPTTSYGLYVDISAGHDSNANSATGVQQYLGFDLAENSQATSTPFLEATAGAGLERELTRGLQFDAVARLAYRSNPDARFVDATTVQVDMGLRRRLGAFDLRGGIDGFALTADAASDSQGGGLMLGARRQLTARLHALMDTRLGLVRYENALQVRDVNQWLASGGVAYRLGEAGAVLQVAALLGADSAVEDDSPYDRSLTGLRFALVQPLAWHMRLRLGASVLKSDYDAVFFASALQAPREDRLTQLRAGVSRGVWQHYELSANVAFASNDSNVDIFAYDRLELKIGLRRRIR